MSNEYPVMSNYRTNTLCDNDSYRKLYQDSMENNEAFWAEQSKRIHWFEDWEQVSKWSYKKPVSIQWYLNGKTNVSYNCIDRHLKQKAQQMAILWEPDNPNEAHRSFTFQQLGEEVNKLSNCLKEYGVKKGDRVTIYMPMVPEAAFAMLACSRIGAIHSVVFGGFSPEALAGRILDCDSDFVITADEGLRAGKKIELKKNVDKALEKCPGVRHCLVFKRTGGDIQFNASKDLWYHEEVYRQSTKCPPEIMDAEDPLFILYTSGSTGKPKGVLHTTGGYLVYASMTHEYVFDYQDGDVYWCTADVGWVTGHSYIVYGPLANAATTVMFEGVPTYPDCSRHWQIVDKFQVNSYYTAPTAIRALMAQSKEFVSRTSRESLRLLGTVGEPINPEAWEWYFHMVGEKRCPIVDTWWQTETGGIMITPLPGATKLKPGSATRPFFGIQTVLMDNQGKEKIGTGTGNLCIKASWPGQMRTVYNDHQRFEDTYFSQYPGYYFTGDGCYRDKEDFLWITGRVDDVLNVSGHRMGTAEVESALVSHKDVSEAAVVGFPHTIKGQGIYAYVSLNVGIENSENLRVDLVDWVKREIGPIAKPDFIQFSSALPKTRSGKIMRRILRKIAANDYQELGDISTLADPSVVEHLIQQRLNR